MRLVGWALGHLLTWSFLQSARADAAPHVAVVVAAPPAQRANIATTLQKQRDLPVALRIAGLPNQPVALDGAREAALAAALLEARQRYIDADFEACLAALPDDGQLTEALSSGDTTTPARVLLWRVACEVGRGGRAAASQAATTFATLGLALPPEVSGVAPDAERTLTDALGHAQHAALIKLELESEPSGREISLDGRPLGCVTPCTSELLPGEHVLVLAGDGTRPLVRRITVDGVHARQTFQLEAAPPELARAQWSARYGGRAVDDAAALRLLAQAVPAQKLVLLKVDALGAGRFELRGAYAVEGNVAARASTEPAPVEALGQDSVRLVEELLVRGQTLAPPRPLWKSGWFWTALGVVAAGAVTTTAVLLHRPAQRTEVQFQ